MKAFIGIDIGGTKCAVSLARVNRGVQILKKLRFESRAQRGCEAMLSDIFAAIDRILAENALTNRDIEAIGISCGGPLDSRRGVVLCPPNLPGWVNVPIVQRMEDRYSVPAFLLNDANACALAEWQLGAGRGSENMIFLTMGTGMGGGVIANGQLLIGASDMAGEIGHLRLSEDGPVGFGKAGSFEGWCSGGGIARQAQALTRKLLSEGVTPAWTRDGHAEDDITAALIADYARAGDAHAIQLYRQVGRMLGKGLALLTDAFNPERIVIGSIYARSGDLLEEEMLSALREEAIPYALDAVKVLPAQLGESLGDCAAVMTALYGLGIDVSYSATESDPRVLGHYERLFTRYSALTPLKEDVMDAYLTLRDCFERGGKLLLCGNGGSAADCDHIVGELMKGFYLKRPVPGDESGKLQEALSAISLSAHAALSTAYNNDVDAQYVFAQQVQGYGRRGDVLFAMSTSGNSANVVNAALAAKRNGLKVIALTGSGGGRLKELSDVCLRAPATVTADIQELHLPIYHTLCAMVEAHFFSE